LEEQQETNLPSFPVCLWCCCRMQEEANPDQNARLAGSTPTDLSLCIYLFPCFRCELQLNPPMDRSRYVNRDGRIEGPHQKGKETGPARTQPVNAAVARVLPGRCRRSRVQPPGSCLAPDPKLSTSASGDSFEKKYGEGSGRAPPHRLRKSGAGRARADRCPRHLK